MCFLSIKNAAFYNDLLVSKIIVSIEMNAVINRGMDHVGNCGSCNKSCEMANKQNANREVILQNEARAFQLRKMGWTQNRIADEIGMTQQGVAKALKRITARFYKDFMSDVKAIKEEQVAQLEHIAGESMQAWSKSKVGSEAGDPRFLSSFMKAKEEIRKIVGADLPFNP